MKHVLLPIDGSTRSLRTIDMVQQTYRPQDTEVTLLMVRLDSPHRTAVGQPRPGNRLLRPGAGF